VSEWTPSAGFLKSILRQAGSGISSIPYSDMTRRVEAMVARSGAKHRGRSGRSAQTSPQVGAITPCQ